MNIMIKYIGEIEAFGKVHEECLRKYLTLKNGIPSHDTIGMYKTEYLKMYKKGL